MGEGTNGAGGQWNSSTLNAQAGGSGSIKTSASFGGGGGAGVMLAYYGSTGSAGRGTKGFVRIVWPGDTRQFPNTNVDTNV